MLRKNISSIIIFLCLVAMLLSGLCIFAILGDYHAGETTYENLHIYVSPPLASSDIILPFEEPDKQSLAIPTVDFDALKQINKDVIAWIQIPGTRIDYPILQGTDNTFYLNHMIDKAWNRCGSIFMDCRSSPDFSDLNTIIHGHHMGNGSMFEDLTLYKSQAFWDEHPYGFIMTPKESYILVFYAGSLVSVSSDLWRINFTGSDDYNNWITSSLSAANVHGNFIPSYLDHIVTLSTCSYEFHEARWLLQGILLPASNLH